MNKWQTGVRSLGELLSILERVEKQAVLAGVATNKVRETLAQLKSGELLGGFLPGGQAYDLLVGLAELSKQNDATSQQQANKWFDYLDRMGVDQLFGGGVRIGLEKAVKEIQKMMEAEFAEGGKLTKSVATATAKASCGGDKGGGTGNLAIGTATIRGLL